MNAAQLPRYRCHKEVHAAKIVEASGLRLGFEGGGYKHTTPEWNLKHMPAVGGYFVVYDDGYESYSPASAFEGGYTRL
jgi:hypothetical protein